MRKVRVAGPLKWILSPVAVAISVSLLLFLSGCGVTVNKLSPTVTITASPASVTSGGASTLTVLAANATGVTVTGTDGSTYTMGATGGTQSVTPKATTTYTATATGPNGQATATAVLTVASTTPVATVTIAANPTTINAGSTSTLTVAATNATTVTITGSDGSSYNVLAAGGTQAVVPTATTTYTATATGATGTTPATATATVTVVPVGPPATPTVMITASPTAINPGGTSTLTVTAANATSVAITGTDGTTYTLPGAGGTQSVTPTTTTTYAATASGPGGTATAQVIVTVAPKPTLTIAANPTSIAVGNSSVLTVTATNVAAVTVTGTDGSNYTLAATGGTQSVTPKSTTTYTATATAPAGNPPPVTATVTVIPPGTLQSIDHVILMLQENHTFDNYFGMLNPYRVSNGWDVGDDGKTYTVDGIDDKLKTIVNQTDEGTSYSPFKLSSTCVDDMSSAWLESYGDVSRYSFLTNRSIVMDGFVHDAEGFAKSCATPGSCSGSFTDTTGQRAMGYYDESYLNYYYYMASQFAVSNRWFSPVSSKSIPNRIATFTGGTTQGLVYDPGSNDKLPQLNINTIYNELDQAGVSWKIYYTVTNGGCTAGTACGSGTANFPDTTFSILSYSYKYMYGNASAAACTGTTKPSSVVGDPSNSFCVDPTHIAPLSTYFQDVANGTLPAYSFIESGSGVNDEHPGSGQSVLTGQAQVANIINKLMSSPSWKDSVFFIAYDEGGGPYDHVPPVPNHSNDFTSANLLAATMIPDISGIAVNPDSNPNYFPCLPTNTTPTAPATTHCDLRASDPGAGSGDAPTKQGFAAQIGFRVPNMIISPFVRKHYVGNNPMDHTAILKFVENRFINSSAHLTARDAAQPDLTDFFDFTNVPWATPPTTMPTPVAVGSSCHAGTMQ